MRTDVEVREAMRLLATQQPPLWIDATDVLRWFLGEKSEFAEELNVLDVKTVFDRVWEER